MLLYYSRFLSNADLGQGFPAPTSQNLALNFLMMGQWENYEKYQVLASNINVNE